MLDGVTGSSSFLTALFITCGIAAFITGATAGCPPLDDTMKLVKAISQSRGARLQDQGRFDLVLILVLHSSLPT